MATDSGFLAGNLGGAEALFVEVRQARQAEVSLYIGIAVDINMPTKPKDRKILVRVTDDMHGLLQSMADKEDVSVPEITRQAILYYFDEGDRIDQYRARIKNLQEQNDSILGTYTSLLHQTEIAQSNFNICVTTLMNVLEGKVSDDEKRQLATQFAPHAELARRQREMAQREYEERQKITSKAVASAQRKKAEAAIESE